MVRTRIYHNHGPSADCAVTCPRYIPTEVEMAQRNNVSGEISVRVSEYDRDVRATLEAVEAGVEVDITIRGVRLRDSEVRTDAVYPGSVIHDLKFAASDITAAPTRPRNGR